MKEKITVFLDRDGVINFDSPDYIKSCEELNFIPGSIEAITNLSRLGHRVCLITNQSVIGRKYVSLEGLKKIFNKMETAVNEKGGKIDHIFFCPHTPDDNCDCRKPKPGMFLQAKEMFGLNLKDSVMVGDSSKDIMSAVNAGCGFKILVKTGNGEKACKELEEKGVLPDYFAKDLFDAHEWIIKNTGRP